MLRSSDFAAPGRLRRLTLTIVPPLLVVVAPQMLVGRHGDELPARAYVDNWAADAAHAPTWESWLAQQWLPLLLFEAALLVPFLCYWRLPRLQRGMAALASAVGASRAASVALSVTALAGAQGPVPAPPWHLPVEIAVTAVAVVLGYLAAGPLPEPPEATAVPGPEAPAMTLGPSQRVLFVTSAWSARRLVAAVALGALTVLSVGNGSGAWQGTALLGVWTVFQAAQARTRLQIDHTGLTVRAAWLPVLRRTVPYHLVRSAQADAQPPEGRYRLEDGGEGWGVVSGRGPVLVVRLGDDRRFVYSTREAEIAAALVNGWLTRQRRGKTASC
ncbi:hypothetical protein [Nonomuraea sp. NPDC048826]|uniref:hypothetical protein n=1 Tax=Nonomuraea sp. NPDC048826 TaxID=3364347 RepID=UPI00371C5485